MSIDIRVPQQPELELAGLVQDTTVKARIATLDVKLLWQVVLGLRESERTRLRSTTTVSSTRPQHRALQRREHHQQATQTHTVPLVFIRAWSLLLALASLARVMTVISVEMPGLQVQVA